jgi:hypothetical protein
MLPGLEEAEAEEARSGSPHRLCLIHMAIRYLELHPLEDGKRSAA